MATGNITRTTADKHIDEVWVEGTIRALEFNLVIAPSVDRSWDYVGHGDTYHKARIPNIESQTKAASTALNATVYTDTEATIQVTTHDACAIKSERIVEVLARNDLKAIMQSKMGYSLGRAIDARLAALFGSLSQTVGAYGVEVTYDNLLRAVQYLEDAGYDMGSDVTWFFSPAQKAGLQKMDTFIHGSYVGEEGARMAHEKALLGTFQGAPIKISNLLNAPAAGQHDNVLFHKETFALIMAQEPETVLDTIALDIADVVVVHQISGAAEVDRYSETPGNITATDEGGVLIMGT